METGSAHVVDLDLRNYVQVARRRWRIIAILGILVPVISVLISLRQEPRYAASSEVLVKRQNLAAGLTPGQVPYTDAQTAERVVETQVQLAREPDLAERVLAAAGGTDGQTAADLLASSTVTGKANSDILVFTVERPSPSEARRLAALYADQFSLYRRQLDVTELDALAASVRGQIASIDPADGPQTPLLEDLRGKLRQIQTLQALQTSSAVVVRTPDAATRVGPTLITMGGGGLLLGLILGVGTAFLLESLDTRVRRSAEIGAILRLPLLARVPEPPPRVRKKSALVVNEEPESPAAEAFAFLRTNLSFANAASGARVIMFCSAMEQEGKSTTVANLAVSYARSGSRVAIVDLDHRRPTMHTLFAVSRSPGITEVSSGAMELDRAMRRVLIPPQPGPVTTLPGRQPGQPSLEVLPAGNAMNPDVDSVVGVLDQLRERFDVVLVDSPPLLLVGEALALSARVDAIVVVGRLNHVRRPMLEELRRALDGAPVRPVGFVATAADEEPGYSHYYGHSYGSAVEHATPAAATAAPAPAAALPERRPQAAATAGPELMGSGDSPEAPRPSPEKSSGGPGPRQDLLDAVVAGGPPATDDQGRSGGTSSPRPGVRPRRSWAQDRSVPSPWSPPGVEKAVALGRGHPSQGNGAEGDGESAEG